MNTIVMSASAARNNFFELLNEVAKGKQVIIKKDNKEVAIISPTPKLDREEFIKAAKKVKGMWKNKPWKSPFDRKDAWGNFGKYDENWEISKEK